MADENQSIDRVMDKIDHNRIIARMRAAYPSREEDLDPDFLIGVLRQGCEIGGSG